MIAVVRIMGGLGNQLFQYAFALALARGGAETFLERRLRPDRYKRKFALDFLSPRLPLCGAKHRILVRAKWDARLLRRLLFMPNPMLVKDGDDWRKFLDAPLPANIHFFGYWQAAATAAEAPELLADLRKIRDGLPPLPESAEEVNIAVHARRLWEYDAQGGIIRKKSKPADAVRLSLQYYKRAFISMREKYNNPHFFIFGDDAKWCADNLLPLAAPNRATLMPPGARPDWQDMLLMAKCEGCILSNSTFAWWGATIGGGYAVAPAEWSNDPARNAIIYPPEWKIIK
ncbi:MAG: alpha-1,2-fucosyltransferase [Gammaproteobacteria bacterium]